MGHFLSSLREREKRDRNDTRGDERKEQGGKRKKNESEETEEIKTFPSTLTCYKDPVSVGHPSDVRYTTSSPHATTPVCLFVLEFNGPVNTILVISSWSIYLTALPWQAYT